MHFFTAVFAALAIIPAVFAAPSRMLAVEKYDGETTGNYIVRLKDGVARSSFLDAANFTVTHQWDIINGFAGKLNDSEIDALRANSDVESIAEDGIMYPLAVTTQTNAPWGLSRLSTYARLTNQNPDATNYRYSYDSSAGLGVDIYIVDTGVYIQHTQFNGRARWGATYGPYPSQDVHGHGTHCAGTAAGTLVGVAKAANIIAVKVLGAGDRGSGTTADIISGLNFVRDSALASRRPSIASMSLGGGISTALDSAVASATNAGVHVIVAAGNDNIDANNVSPARAPSAITVGATNIADSRASFSNYGSVLDIFAPGEGVISSWITDPNSFMSLSGTSMATPHISGLVATLISAQGNLSPAAMAAKVKNLDRKGIITNIPAGTVNELAQNGIYV